MQCVAAVHYPHIAQRKRLQPALSGLCGEALATHHARVDSVVLHGVSALADYLAHRQYYVGIGGYAVGQPRTLRLYLQLYVGNQAVYGNCNMAVGSQCRIDIFKSGINLSGGAQP